MGTGLDSSYVGKEASVEGRNPLKDRNPLKARLDASSEEGTLPGAGWAVKPEPLWGPGSRPAARMESLQAGEQVEPGTVAAQHSRHRDWGLLQYRVNKLLQHRNW